VLRARLEDGLFFFHEDRKRPLADRCAELSGIVFQNKLGTMAAKSERITRLAVALAGKIAPELEHDAIRAARLAKADLLTAMVGEFPTLQGIMGRVYALHDGEKAEVAQAIEEHYLPLRAGGELPQSLLGALVGIADRMDTLVGCFAIGEKPTGNKDAFGLRRQAIGLINVIKGCNLSLSLGEVAAAALQGYEGVVAQNPEVLDEVLSFIRFRFENEQIAAGLPPGTGGSGNLRGL
jgi:Glycyl-tRNA synthetase, beta subunit